MRHIQRPANFAVFSVLLVSALLIIALDADASLPTASAAPSMIFKAD
jgi:hypothetical protein